MSSKPSNLERILELSPLSASRFITANLPAAPLGARGTFGGTLIAQSLLAALYTVPEDFEPTSLHSYFLNAGNPSIMINYHVQDLRHGRNFIHKQVKGYQHEKLIFTSVILFSIKREHDSLHHLKTIETSKIPKIDDLREAGSIFEDKVLKRVSKCENSKGLPERSTFENHVDVFNLGVIDYRFPDDIFYAKEKIKELTYYVNCRQPVTKENKRDKYEKITPYNDPRYNYVALAYISDSYFLLTLPYFHRLPMYCHNFSVSLDHSIHFHQLPMVNDWLLFQVQNPSSRSDKHLMEGEYFSSKTGEIVASISQEGYVTYDSEDEIRAKF